MSKDYSKFKEKYLDSLDVDNVTGEQMIERTNCLECEEYNHEKYYCPKFCDVIREAVKDIRKDSIPIDWIESQVDKGKWAELVQRWAERKSE